MLHQKTQELKFTHSLSNRTRGGTEPGSSENETHRWNFRSDLHLQKVQLKPSCNDGQTLSLDNWKASGRIKIRRKAKC